MRSLTKQDIARRDAIINRLGTAENALEMAHSTLLEHIATYNEEVDKYNEVLQEARGFAEDMKSSIESYMEERSEKWLGGDSGQAFEQWKSDWEELDNELQDVEKVDETEWEGLEHADKVRDAPEKPSV